jgi:hypothetical protein
MAYRSSHPVPAHDPPGSNRRPTDSRPGQVPRWWWVNITPIERAARVFGGALAIVSGSTMLADANSALAVVLWVLFVLGRCRLPDHRRSRALPALPEARLHATGTAEAG